MADTFDSDRWYFVVECEECGRPISLGEAPSPAQVPSPVTEGGQVICPHSDCRSQRIFLSGEVRRMSGKMLAERP
jgi:hypothetical protein